MAPGSLWTIHIDSRTGSGSFTRVDNLVIRQSGPVRWPDRDAVKFALVLRSPSGRAENSAGCSNNYHRDDALCLYEGWTTCAAVLSGRRRGRLRSRQPGAYQRGRRYAPGPSAAGGSDQCELRPVWSGYWLDLRQRAATTTTGADYRGPSLSYGYDSVGNITGLKIGSGGKGYKIVYPKRGSDESERRGRTEGRGSHVLLQA